MRKRELTVNVGNHSYRSTKQAQKKVPGNVVIMQVALFIPLFVASCFIPYLNLVWLMLIGMFSYTYEQGKIYGLAGENGAGKTTLFRCLTGLLPYEGTIRKRKEVKVGYLPAECYFYSLITAREYIEFCLKAYGEQLSRTRLDEINEEVFHLPLDRYASAYSTGMKKKLAFLALYLQHPDVYILDEPFNGVDLKGCILLKNLIRRIKEQQKTVIVSSHQLASLHELCDAIHYLCEGKIIKEFTSEPIEEIERFILESV